MGMADGLLVCMHIQTCTGPTLMCVTNIEFSVLHVVYVTRCFPGSVLGPLLFSIYINGITETSISVNSYRVLYADDVLLYRGIAEPKADINELERWSEEQLL